MAAELLPCPWCGDPLESVSVSEGSTFRWRKVDGCCADGPEVRHNTMAGDQEAAEADSRERAIAAWNRRAHDIDALRAEVDALKHDVAQYMDAAKAEHEACQRAEAQAAELAEVLRHVRNNTSVTSLQIDIIDAALARAGKGEAS